MTFDKLADRCLLFVDAEKNTLIELLKEAEIEMSRKCNIYENSQGYYDTGITNIYELPKDYKQMILGRFENYKLNSIHEDEVGYDSDGSIRSGTPTGYFIRNNFLHLNHKPSAHSTSQRLQISYYAVIDNAHPQVTTTGTGEMSYVNDPEISEIYHRDLCDYAIAIASAKKLPDLHMKHWGMWMQNLQSITNEDADRELVHSIKEII